MSYYFMQIFYTNGPLKKLKSGSLVPGMKPGAFTNGRKVELDNNEPIQLSTRANSEGPMPELFNLPAFIPNNDFITALEECGVDNIDYYDCVIHDQETGKTYDNYKLGNILGAVDIIDLEASEIDPDSPPKIAMLFDNIVFDESRAKDFDIFRPVNKLSSVVVSQKIRDHIESKGIFSNVRFMDPEDMA